MAALAAADKAKEEMEAARVQVMECEKEIQGVKTALRQLGTGDEGAAPNSLEFAAIKTAGFPTGAQPSFVLQLSSPVEEATITDVLDEDDKDQEGITVTFNQVEMSTATIVMTAKDMDIPMGVSTAHDVAAMCPFDAMSAKEEYVSEYDVECFAEGGDAKKDESEPESKEEDATKEKEEPAEEKEEASSSKTTPLCTVTLRVTYKPSIKDKREELYDVLNKASQRKAQAIDRLRKSATAVSRAGPTTSTAVTTTSRSGPAVKSGFLNKKKKRSKAMEVYDRTLGPNSFIRRFVPAAKDYIIFFGAAAFLHFKGHLLALPAPV